MKKVSIWIICYNQENFIRETIESCLNQTYKNIEICISDDCSTDKTYDIILEYKNKYPDIIKCFRQNENRWKTAICLNTIDMLKMCTWKYIARLDWDDIMLPERIEKQVNFLDNNPNYIWVSGWLEAFDSNTWKILWNIHKDLKVFNRTTDKLIIYWNSIPACLMYRNNNQIKPNINLKKMADWLFYIELSILWKIWHIDEYLWKYRIHNNNSIKKDLSFDYLKTLEIIEIKYPQYKKDIKKWKSYFYLLKGYNKINTNLNWLFFLIKWFIISPVFFIKTIITYFLKIKLWWTK